MKEKQIPFVELETTTSSQIKNMMASVCSVKCGKGYLWKFDEEDSTQAQEFFSAIKHHKTFVL